MKHSGKATASMGLGAMGPIALLVPGVGIPFTIVGLALGIMGLESSKRHRAKAGIVICSLGLLLAAVVVSILIWGISSGSISSDILWGMIGVRCWAMIVGMLGVVMVLYPSVRTKIMWSHRHNRYAGWWSFITAIGWAFVSFIWAYKWGNWDMTLFFAIISIYWAVLSIVEFRSSPHTIETGHIESNIQTTPDSK